MRASNLNALSAPRIVHKDDSIIVVDKPAGMPAVSLEKKEGGTLTSWLIGKFPALCNLEKGELEAGLVHRLDNDTSGLMIAARTAEAYRSLRKQFDDGRVDKEYVALVVGNPAAKGTINTPIAHHPRKKKKMIASPDGRPAETRFKVIKRFGSKYALLQVKIKTGVRHQIRVHLASIGFPLAGDSLYRNPKKRSEDTLDLNRHFLHAAGLGFLHPKTDKWVEFSSELPADLKAALKSLTNL